MTGYVATAEIDVAAPAEAVWRALTEPAMVAQYMWGTRLETDWQVGGPVSWSGELEGRPYQDRGTVLEVVPAERLVVTHYSPLSGEADVPESYHTLVYTLEPRGGGTHLSLSQDGSATEDEAEHSQGMWESMLAGLKDVVERG